MAIDASFYEEYEEKGYAIARGVFTKEEVAEIAAGFDRFDAQGRTHHANYLDHNMLYVVDVDDAGERITKVMRWPAYADEMFARFRIDPRYLEIVEPLLGNNLKQITNQLNFKPPEASKAYWTMHQDYMFRTPTEAYRNLRTSFIQTGLAVDPHTVENGALKMYPGSHKFEELDLPGRVRKSTKGFTLENLSAAGLGPDLLEDIVMEPGDVAIWNAYTIHGSPTNRAKDFRRLMINGYVRAEDCDRGEWAFRDGEPVELGEPVLTQYDGLHSDPGPKYLESHSVKEIHDYDAKKRHA